MVESTHAECLSNDTDTNAFTAANLVPPFHLTNLAERVISATLHLWACL